MSEMKDILKRVSDGSLDFQKALGQIKRVMVTDDPTRPAAELTYEQSIDRQWADDNDYEDTFSEVTAFWIMGKITDEQYAQIREVVTPQATGMAALKQQQVPAAGAVPKPPVPPAPPKK